MPNTPVRAAAEGLPLINRRKALTVTGSGLAAALATMAASTVPAQPAGAAVEQPYEKPRRLAKELSLALDDWSDGQFMAEIYPSKSRDYPIGFGDVHAMAQARSNADAELIRLGKELDRELELESDLSAKVKRLYPAWADGPISPIPDGEYEAWQAHSVASGLATASEELNACCERLDVLVKSIDALPAATVAGFAVKANAILWDLFLWDGCPGESDDYNTKAFRQFVAAMRSVGGVS